MGHQAPQHPARHPAHAPVAVWRSTGFVIYDEVEGGDPLVHTEWLTRPCNETEPAAAEQPRASVTGDDDRRLTSAALRALQAGNG